MKKLMKAKKDIAGLQFLVSMGELVNCTPQGECHAISPLGGDGLTLNGIPAHDLIETHCGPDS